MLIFILQTAKKEVIFCQFEIVGVRWYGRVQIGKKQVTARKIRCFPCGFIIIILFRQEQALALRLNTQIKSLVVERLFRQSKAVIQTYYRFIFLIHQLSGIFFPNKVVILYKVEFSFYFFGKIFRNFAFAVYNLQHADFIVCVIFDF